MPEYSPFAQALAGSVQGDIQEPIRGMILQALQPDNLTKMIIKEDGGIDFKITPQTLEKVAGAMGPAKGPSAGEMRGLTPEQMMSIIQATQAGEQSRRETLQQFMGIPTQRAQIEGLKAQVVRNIAEALATRPPLSIEEQIALRKTPVGGVPPLSFEERLKIAETPKAIERGIEWRNKKTGELKYLPKGQVPSGADWEKAPAIERQVSELPGMRFEESVERNVANMADKVRSNLAFPGNPALIDYINNRSTSNVGFIWGPAAKESIWYDPRTWVGEVDQAIEVKLPLLKGRQVTMKDVREEAADREIAVEQVLAEIHAAYQKLEKGKK
jgi:hypothetical protein